MLSGHVHVRTGELYEVAIVTDNICSLRFSGCQAAMGFQVIRADMKPHKEKYTKTQKKEKEKEAADLLKIEIGALGNLLDLPRLCRYRSLVDGRNRYAPESEFL
jgi:hypothetical protein